MLKDDTRFVTRVETLPGEPPFADAAILFMDHKRHRDHRTLVQPSFVPGRATWWLDNFIKGMVGELADAINKDGLEPIFLGAQGTKEALDAAAQKVDAVLGQ